MRARCTQKVELSPTLKQFDPTYNSRSQIDNNFQLDVGLKIWRHLYMSALRFKWVRYWNECSSYFRSDKSGYLRRSRETGTWQTNRGRFIT